MHYYKRNIKDFRVETFHLTSLERGIYNQLIDFYYLTEKPLISSKLDNMLKIENEKETECLNDVLSDFFTYDPEKDSWSHERIDEDIKQYRKRGWFPSDPNESRGRQTSQEWLKTRERIFNRDNHTCTYCGVKDFIKLECDHVIPVSRGGLNDDSNLTTSCKTCNRQKSNKLVSEWKGVK